MPILPASDNPHLRAVKAAYDALRRAEDATSQDDELHALMEAVWWISTANDYLRKLHGSTYESFREGTHEGRMIKAMWWVRSAAMHDPFGVTGVTELSDAYADTYSDSYDTFVWLPLADVQLFDEGAADSVFGRDQYSNDLADLPVIDTVREVVEWLHHLRTEDLKAARKAGVGSNP